MKRLLAVSVLSAVAITASPVRAETWNCAAGYITDINANAALVKYNSGDASVPSFTLTIDQTGFWSKDWDKPAKTATVIIGYQKTLIAQWDMISSTVQNAFLNRVPVMITYTGKECDNFQGGVPKYATLSEGFAIKMCSNEDSCKPVPPTK